MTSVADFTNTITEHAEAFTDDVAGLWSNVNSRLEATLGKYGLGAPERELFFAEMLKGKITDYDAALAYLSTKDLTDEQLAEFTEADFNAFQTTMEKYEEQKDSIQGFFANLIENVQEWDTSTQVLAGGSLAGLIYGITNPSQEGIFSSGTLIKTVLGAGLAFAAYKGIESLTNGEEVVAQTTPGTPAPTPAVART